MFVKPAPDRFVRDPESKRLLPDDGAEVPQAGYWMRRLRDGDVIPATPAASAAPAAPAAPAKE